MGCRVSYVPLGELAEFESGGTPSKKIESYWHGSIPWISAKTLAGDTVYESDLTISKEGLESGSKLAPKGSLLLLTRGSGLFKRIPLAIAEKQVAYNQDIKCINSNAKGISNRYLFYALKALEPAISAMVETTGIGAGKLATDRLKALPIPVLAGDARAKVTSIADCIYDKTSLNAKLNGYLLELMNGQYRHSFCCNKSSLGSIYDIANVVYGAAFRSALFNEEKVGYPLIRIRDLSTFSPQYWTNEAHPKRVFVHPGDVLAGMDAEFTPCLWQGEMAVLNQRVCLFEPAADSGVSRSYLLMALKPLLAFIQNYASGTTVAHMGKGDLEALNVPIPARGDLERFNAIAEPLREQIVQNSIQNRKLAALRDALLPKLMSGEIDVSKIDLTQPNSHLRER